MKNVFRIMLIAAAATVFALPAYAQDAAPASTLTPAQEEEKAKLYTEFLKLIKGGPEQQRQASVVGKDYLAKYGTPEDDIVKYIRNWVEKYEQAVRDFEFKEAVAKNPDRAFQLAREQLAASPDNLDLNLALVQAGFNAVAAKNTSHNAEAAQAARRALQLIEGGKTAQNYVLFANRDEAVAGLSYMIGYFLRDSSPAEAAQALVKAAQSNTKFKTEPTTYVYLGGAYYDGEFKKLAADYKTMYEGKEETPESRAAYEKLMQSLDRVIDAFARAAALSKDAAQKKAIMEQLTAFYKSRNSGSDAGLNEYLAGALSRPVPQPGQPAHPAVSPSAASTTPTPQPASTPPASTPPASNPGTKPATPPANNGTPPTKPRQ
ncbi:MAG TPA: hypothetical protein VG148_16065 [Pyrinomonadaceae bacterium]|nr:hypothetical protein [Pyrinomonadaceae bacterium]